VGKIFLGKKIPNHLPRPQVGANENSPKKVKQMAWEEKYEELKKRREQEISNIAKNIKKILSEHKYAFEIDTTMTRCVSLSIYTYWRFEKEVFDIYDKLRETYIVTDAHLFYHSVYDKFVARFDITSEELSRINFEFDNFKIP